MLDDFQALETEARRVALQLMGQAVARKLNADHGDEEVPHPPCACGTEARFADEHFPDAVQIVDIFHAKGHLFEVAKAIYGHASEVGERWARKRREELDEGRVEEVLLAALRSFSTTCDEARRNVEYFSTNRERMNYPKFRAMGLCVATGVVEGGCKHIVGTRLKRGGMRWTVPDYARSSAVQRTRRVSDLGSSSKGETEVSRAEIVVTGPPKPELPPFGGRKLSLVRNQDSL